MGKRCLTVAEGLQFSLVAERSLTAFDRVSDGREQDKREHHGGHECRTAGVFRVEEVNLAVHAPRSPLFFVR